MAATSPWKSVWQRTLAATDGQPRVRGMRGALPAVAWTAVAVVAPVVAVYACLVASAAIARPLSDLGGASYNAARLAVSAALCLAPIAVWPFRLRTYAAVAGGSLVALALVNLVHVFEYSELLTIGAFDAAFSTSAREAGEYIAGRAGSAVPALLATLVAGALVVWAVRRVGSPVGVPWAWRATAALGGVAAAVALAVYPMGVFPVSTLKNAADFAVYRGDLRRAQEARSGASFAATPSVVWADAPVVVVVVGESVQRRRLGIYGAERPTTPWLSGSPDVVAFADAVAASPVTQTSVAMMMTAAEPETVRDHAGQSWLTLAREVGFDTVWLSNQDRTDGTAMTTIAEDADEVVYTSHSWSASGQLDEDLLPELDRVLARRDGPLAVVLHLMGSHDDYAVRYPARFNRFAASGQADDERMLDYYDNSVLYTDWILEEVFKRIGATGAPAVGVYVADHGENLYDTDARMRGHGVPGTTRFELEVPLVVWTNGAFRKARPDVAAAVARARGLPVTTGDLFYGLADLIGADWEGRRPGRSPFGAGYEPPPRRVLLPTMEVVEAKALGVVPTATGGGRPSQIVSVR